MTYGDFGDKRPRHEQIAADLRALIMAGDLAGPIPSVAALSAEDWFAVSTATIQRALAVLREEGLIRSRQGTRTEVVEGVLDIIETSAYLDTTKVRYELLDVVETRPPAQVQQAVGWSENSLVVMRKRLMLRLDGRPVELSWSYYPMEVARGTDLERPKMIKGGAPRVLGEIGRAPAEQDDIVTTRPPTTEELRHLRLPPRSSVLRTLRVIRDVQGCPVEVSVLVKDGNRLALKSRQMLH
jgi:GntR family transcriptional regulator